MKQRPRLGATKFWSDVVRGVRLSLMVAVALVALQLGGFATPLHAAADCNEPPTVRIQEWTGDIINIVPWVADTKGFYSKNCLDVKLIPLVMGGGAIAVLVSGSIDFINQAPDNIMRARARGVDVRITSNMYRGHWNALVAGKGLASTHGKGYPAMMSDLVGKKIGVTSLGGSTEAFIRSAFEGAGFDSFSATYIAVGGVRTAVPALKQGSVDAAMMFGTGPELAEALGVGKILLDYRTKGVGPDSVQVMWGATLGWSAYGPYIDENRETITAFTRANNEAIEWIQDPQNRVELYRVIGDRMKFPDTLSNPEETLKRVVDTNAEILGTGIPKSSIDGWNDYIVKHLKQIDAPVPYEELVWETGR